MTNLVRVHREKCNCIACKRKRKEVILLTNEQMVRRNENISKAKKGVSFSDSHKVSLSKGWIKRKLDPMYVKPGSQPKYVMETRICICGCSMKFECKGNGTKKYFDHTHALKHSAKLRKGKPIECLRGINHPNWKGGSTPLYNAIRLTLENKNWKLGVFKRDKFICKECGVKSNGSNIEAHHIKGFAAILGEFLQKYSQFSPIEDQETLVGLSVTYEPFWNLDNGQTLCGDCHKLTDSYLKR